jgi:hypothetical protein
MEHDAHKIEHIGSCVQQLPLGDLGRAGLELAQFQAHPQHMWGEVFGNVDGTEQVALVGACGKDGKGQVPAHSTICANLGCPL